MGLYNYAPSILGIFYYIFIIVLTALYFPTLSMAIRRLQDSERNGTLALFFFAPLGIVLLAFWVSAIFQLFNRNFYTSGIVSLMFPIMIVGLILLIIWCSQPGSKGPNQYGADPTVTQ